MKVMTAGGAGSGGMKKTSTTRPTTTNADHDDGTAGDATKEGPFPAFATKAEHSPDKQQQGGPFGGLEIEEHNTEQQHDVEEIPLHDHHDENAEQRREGMAAPPIPYSDNPQQSSLPASVKPSSSATDASKTDKLYHEFIWLIACFVGIMLSFVGYGLLLEYTTSGGRQLHEMSFLFVTSALYTVTAAVGRYVRDETPSTIPPAQFALLGLTSMGSTFCSVRSLRYVAALSYCCCCCCLLLVVVAIVVALVVVVIVIACRVRLVEYFSFLTHETTTNM
jgi:hypothetical protein